MDGLMMRDGLLIGSILRRAETLFGSKEVVSRRGDGSIVRTTWGEVGRRTRKLMTALKSMGVQPGDRVATFAWNSQRHLELYFAVPMIGAVLHTINIRLPREQIVYIINHAQDRMLFVDKSLACLFAELQEAGSIPSIERFVIIDELAPPAPALPRPALPRSALDYEALIEPASVFEGEPVFDEETASGLCYTSATTGDPKGVLYSHRSTVLHAMGNCMVDGAAMCEREIALPVVPMFHVNAWGMPYSCAMVGAKLVLPGSGFVGQPLAELLEAEKVTCTAGVPTVWTLLYQHLQEKTYDLSHLKTILVGGAAASRTLIENYKRDFGITVIHAWGMTETSPMGTVSRLRSESEGWSQERKLEALLCQGLPVPGVEVRILDEHDRDLPWDGQSPGELLVRGPWIAREYYNNPAATAAFQPEGWFRTGDVAVIDPFGYVRLTDRKKDLIKRKGEWISSVDMENAAVAHPGVLEAAVVARPDAVCDEVPVCLVVKKEPQASVTADDILALLAQRFAKWQLPRPEDILFVESLPKTSVGKLDKKRIRSTMIQPGAAAVPGTPRTPSA